MKTKVLILHTSVGYGIKVAAQNIHQALGKSADYESRIEDIQEVESGMLVSGSEKIYTTILDRISPLWGFLYSSKVVMALTLPLRKIVAGFKSKRTLQLLREYQPAIVMSTQAAPSAVLSYLKSKKLYRGKVVAVFSDYHLHPFWLFDEVDLYICNIPEQAEKLKAMGIAPERIAVTGMPLDEKFFREVSREDACRELGLLTTMPTVMISSGGRARDAVKDLYVNFLRSPKSYQIAVVCGHNEALKKELESISAPDRHPVKIFGYINNMEVVMSAASVMVGKTGGPTMCEAVVKKLPIILTDVRPGHEWENLEYLMKFKIADYARIPREAVFLAEQVLDGKIKRNWPEIEAKVIKPPGSLTIIEALDSIKPETPPIEVKNYQNQPV
jgi:processive 1,2-diacylglycerol beta-glucosyltransferase